MRQLRQLASMVPAEVADEQVRRREERDEEPEDDGHHDEGRTTRAARGGSCGPSSSPPSTTVATSMARSALAAASAADEASSLRFSAGDSGSEASQAPEGLIRFGVAWEWSCVTFAHAPPARGRVSTASGP
jgi:hypothetical protein